MARKPQKRLPLPGQQNTTIYQQRRVRRARYVHPVLRMVLPAAAVGLIAGTLLIGWAVTRIPLTLIVNGQEQSLLTHRRLVSRVILQAGISPDDVLQSIPSLEERVSRGEEVNIALLRPVMVHYDGQTTRIQPQTDDAQAIVRSAGVILGENDVVEITRSLPPSPEAVAANPALGDLQSVPREIEVFRAHTIVVNEVDRVETRQVSVNAAGPTLGHALTRAGYTFYEADRIEPALSTPLTADAVVTIERSTPVTLIDAGVPHAIRSTGETVADVLAALDIAPVGDDYTVPALNAAIQPDSEIQLFRVTEDVSLIEEEIPFSVTYIPDPDMLLDELREVQPGVPGVEVRQVITRYENDLEVSQQAGARWIEKDPEPQIIAYGTRIVFQTLEVEGGVLRYWRKLRVLATSYSPSTAGSKQPGDPFFGLSATGAEVVRGIVATDPRVIPLGSELYVPEYGYARALDIGGAVKGMRVDLGYDDQNLVLWNNWTDIYLLPPVPPPDEMVWVIPQEFAPEINAPEE